MTKALLFWLVAERIQFDTFAAPHREMAASGWHSEGSLWQAMIDDFAPETAETSSIVFDAQYCLRPVQTRKPLKLATLAKCLVSVLHIHVHNRCILFLWFFI